MEDTQQLLDALIINNNLHWKIICLSNIFVYLPFAKHQVKIRNPKKQCVLGSFTFCWGDYRSPDGSNARRLELPT